MRAFIRGFRAAPACALLGTALTTVPLSAHAYVLKAPWRGDSLPHGSFMRSRGHLAYDCGNGGTNCSLDIGGIRWDEAAGNYTISRTKAASSTNFSDYVAWGMPLYSPVDGEIVACWRNMPDDGEDGSEPPECPADTNATTCIAGGNHVTIRTFDGHLVTMAHFMERSIPERLCPIEDRVLFNTDPKRCNIAGMEAALREGARLDLRGFPPSPVRKGEFLGRIGASGATSGPHLHLGTSEYTIDASGNTCEMVGPIELTEAFYQVRSPGVEPTAQGWNPLQGEELTIDGTTDYLLWGDPLGPRVDELPSEEGSAPALVLTPAGGVAAYRNAQGRLTVTGFVFDGEGQFVPGMPRVEGAVSDVALSRINIGSRHVVAAVRNGSEQLQLIPYFFRANGDLVRGAGRTESTAGVVRVEAARAPGHDGIVVAIKNSQNAISVIDYGVTLTEPEQLRVDRRGSVATSSAIADVDVATVVMGRGLNETTGAFRGVVTAERRSATDTVWLRSFRVGSSGATVTLVDTEQVMDADAGSPLTATDVDVAVTGTVGGRELVVLSAATAAGLRVQSWAITTAGQLTRVEQVNAGTLTQLASGRVHDQDMLVGGRTAAGNLSLLSFNVTSQGQLRRVGTRDAGGIAALALDGRTANDDLVVLASSSSTRELSFLHYLTNYSAAQ